MPASDGERIGDDVLLDRLECAWAEQCGACLNVVNEQVPKVLAENERLTEQVAALRPVYDAATTLVDGPSIGVAPRDYREAFNALHLVCLNARAALAAAGGDA